MFSQDYPDFEVIFFDANSSDKTYELACKYLNEHKNLQCIKNDKRKYQVENLLIGAKMAPDNSILIWADGDDFLADENVLNRINAEYINNDCWMTYGSFEEFFGTNTSAQPTDWIYKKYSKEVRDNKSYRKYTWMASHLRTFRKELVLKINENDLKDVKTKDFVSYAGDLSIMFPMLEMCPEGKSRHIPDKLYIYNRENENNESKQNQDEISRIDLYLRNKPVYETLEKLYL